jgi:hypothetical protein
MSGFDKIEMSGSAALDFHLNWQRGGEEFAAKGDPDNERSYQIPGDRSKFGWTDSGECGGKCIGVK